ncbi:hypothetical protein Moror_565 [Moniliophthora roreri MCA 2997]|uniref:Uncharacterized protein n=1 Tax=Moniliophthora roreri (strain MCA 2997) TaxID=1381753 RepID=V2XZE5_MONRO|nr:hypothetical protein Moror_565 [Moniliophthora roreri MCA 2997]
MPLESTTIALTLCSSKNTTSHSRLPLISFQHPPVWVVHYGLGRANSRNAFAPLNSTTGFAYLEGVSWRLNLSFCWTLDVMAIYGRRLGRIVVSPFRALVHLTKAKGAEPTFLHRRILL